MIVNNIVNSFIGRHGNIGLRTSYIINELNNQNIENFSYSRGCDIDYRNNKNMGLLGHIPRVLNAYRIYINKNFNHRKLDIKLFELFVSSSLSTKNKTSHIISHLWESSPKLIEILKNMGHTVLLDIPIAPTEYGVNLLSKYDELGKIDYSFNISCENKSFLLADYIISPSEFITNILFDSGVDRKKIFTIPFGTNLLGLKKKDFSYDKNGVDFCFAGNINKRKGIEYLLKAWDHDVFKNDRLHLCGRLYPEIEKLLKNYNFNNIIIPGFINTREYFKKCDVYVFPSFLEGSSKSIYEAMSASMPCIVTENSGSVIRNNIDGFVIDIGDELEIRNKMNYFKNNPEKIRSMGDIAYKNVQQYSWDSYARNIVDIYKDIIRS